MLLKKGFPDAVRKARRAAARRGRRLRIMFTDEARFGRMNRIRPCWAPVSTRPEVAAQLIREYIYLYGAVSPKDGTCVYLIMPTSNTACFQVFLNVLARAAVHRVTAWYRSGADLNDLLPKLATYLGHTGLAGTQRYLTMTQELLAEASSRFEAFAGGHHH